MGQINRRYIDASSRYCNCAVVRQYDKVYLKNLLDVTTERKLPEFCKIVLKRIRSVGINTIHDLWINTSYTYKELIQALIILYFNGYVYVAIDNEEDNLSYIDGIWRISLN